MARLPLSELAAYPRKILSNGSSPLNVSSIHKRDISRRLIFPRLGAKGYRAYLPSEPPFTRYGRSIFLSRRVPAAWLPFSGTTCCSPAQRSHGKPRSRRISRSSSRALSPLDTCAHCLPLLSTASSKAPFVRGPRNLELSPEDTRVCASRMSIYIATRARQHENKRRKCRGNEKESETLLACKQVASDSLIVAGSLGMIRSHATIFRLPSFPKQKLGRFEPAHCLESR